MTKYVDIVDYEVVLEILRNLKSSIRPLILDKDFTKLAKEKYDKLSEIEKQSTPDNDLFLKETIKKYSPILQNIVNGNTSVENILKDI